MKVCCFMIMLSLLVSSLHAQRGYADKEVVDYARALPVRKLDRSLPTQRLDDWLRSGPAHLENVAWEMSRGCDIKRGADESSKQDASLCAKFLFKRGSGEDAVDGLGLIKVGTVAEGISGPPRFKVVKVGAPVGGYSAWTKLSDLPGLLKKASSLPKADRAVLNYARALDVHELDPTLPSQRLDEWLRLSPARIDYVEWRLSPNCDRKPVDLKPTDEWPVCVQVVFLRNGVGGWAMVRVGTGNKPISGLPRVDYFTMMADPPIAHRPKTLSELPKALDEASSNMKLP
jgi:hypothetical protein